MLLQQPHWLILAIPLAALLIMWRLPNRLLLALRTAVISLVLLTLSRPSIQIEDRSNTAVVIADRSESMPAGAESAEKEIVDLAQSSIQCSSRMAVISFGRRSVLEHAPQAGAFPGFVTDVGKDQSDLASALESARILFGRADKGRILVISDGRWTGRDPVAVASKLAALDIPVDYRMLQRTTVNDLSISTFRVPESVLPGQSYMLEAVIHSPTAQGIRYELKRGAEPLSSGDKSVAAGTSRLVFRDRAPASGVCQYSLSLTSANGVDPIPENNHASAIVGIQGPRPVLVASPAGADSGLAKLLAKAGLDVKAAEASDCSWSLTDISQYSAIILDNTFASDIGPAGMDTLATWVEHAGGGLMVTGGRNSYGTGGYFKSPLERVMPVSMELRREHRKLSVAIVVAIDRSGSMAAAAGGGKRKIDLANIGTVQVLDLLSPIDEFGTVAVDSIPHTILPLDTVERNKGSRDQLMRIDSMGGGIFIYEALAASTKMLLGANASTRHILLFADASDSEEPGRYRELLDEALKQNITVSVVGLGTPADCDAELLRDIAKRGAGTCMFTADAEQIPRLFAQDTFTVSRSSFIEEPTQFKILPGMRQLTQNQYTEPPPVGGYNLCYARPGANVVAVTSDEYKAPLAAFWHAGNGRVLCLTAEADGKYTGAFAQWQQAPDFLASLAGWVSGEKESMPDDMLVSQELRGGLYTLELHLDPERSRDSFLGTPLVKVLRGEYGSRPAVESASLTWRNADELFMDCLIGGNETLLATVEFPGLRSITLPPVRLPYSPEFRPDREGRGQDALERIARMTGGRERLDITGIWDDMAPSVKTMDLTPFLILAALFCFLAEIFERRTALLSSTKLFSNPFNSIAEAFSTSTLKTRKMPLPKQTPQAVTLRQEPEPQIHQAAATEEKPKAADPEDTIAAMRQARKKASRRMTD